METGEEMIMMGRTPDSSSIRKRVVQDQADFVQKFDKDPGFWKCCTIGKKKNWVETRLVKGIQGFCCTYRGSPLDGN